MATLYLIDLILLLLLIILPLLLLFVIVSGGTVSEQAPDTLKSVTQIFFSVLDISAVVCLSIQVFLL